MPLSFQHLSRCDCLIQFPPIMNADKYQQLLVRRAVKAANKKSRHSKTDLDLETLRDLKVATASPFSRILIALLGSILLGLTIYLQVNDAFSWLLTVLGIVGFYILVVAIRGRKKRIFEIETTLDALDAGGTLIEAIIENLDISIDL